MKKKNVKSLLSTYGFHAFVLSEFQSTELCQVCFHLCWVRYPFFMPVLGLLLCSASSLLQGETNHSLHASKLHGGHTSSFPLNFFLTPFYVNDVYLLRLYPFPPPPPFRLSIFLFGGRRYGRETNG